jgi:hypothetical protein
VTAEPLLVFKTPVLSSWWDRYDPYERALVARIRAGRHSPDLFDHNRLFLGERPPPGASPTYEFPSPVRNMTPEELRQARLEAAERRKQAMAEAKARLNSPEWLAEVAERKRIKAERHAIRHAAAIERERQNREWLERKAAREAREKEREAEWAREAERRREEASQQPPPPPPERELILSKAWQCGQCGSKATIAEKDGLYLLGCVACKHRAIAAHAQVMAFMRAA